MLCWHADVRLSGAKNARIVCRLAFVKDLMFSSLAYFKGIFNLALSRRGPTSSSQPISIMLSTERTSGTRLGLTLLRIEKQAQMAQHCQLRQSSAATERADSLAMHAHPTSAHVNGEERN
eukprot:4656667-Pleurochrysis_carterae.AAC.2